MLSKEFLTEYRNPDNPERYIYDRVDFLREPHFKKNLTREPKYGTTFMHMTVEDVKPLIDKISIIRKQLRNMLNQPGDALYILDPILKFSVLLERALNQPNTPKGKNIYYLISLMPPSIDGEFVIPNDTRSSGEPLAPRFDINTRKIVNI